MPNRFDQGLGLATAQGPDFLVFLSNTVRYREMNQYLNAVIVCLKLGTVSRPAVRVIVSRGL